MKKISDNLNQQSLPNENSGDAHLISSHRLFGKGITNLLGVKAEQGLSKEETSIRDISGNTIVSQ